MNWTFRAIEMIQRRGKRLKKSNGTIKTHGDPKRVATLLGIDDKQDGEFVEERKAKEQNRVVSRREPPLVRDIRVLVKAHEAPSSDVESLVDSLCDSDTFNSSDEMDSTAYSPSLSNLNQDISQSVDNGTKPWHEMKLPDTDNDMEVQDVCAVRKLEEPDKSRGSKERDNALKKGEELVSYLSDVQELRYTLPAIPETKKRPHYKPRTLADYRKWKREQEERKLGQLGFDRLNPEYQKRVAKTIRQKEYSELIKQCPITARHSKQVVTFPVIPEQSKRQQALEYAKKQQELMPHIKERVQPPKRRKQKNTNIMSLVDIMKARHDREKALVDTLRQEVAALR